MAAVCATLQDVKENDKVKFGRYGRPWTVEKRVEPQPKLSHGGGGYITFRTVKGSFKCIGHRNWDMPVIIVEKADEHSQSH